MVVPKYGVQWETKLQSYNNYPSIQGSFQPHLVSHPLFCTLEQSSLHGKRERERAQEMKPIDVLSTFFHMPNVVLPKRMEVPKARRSRIQVIEMKRWPHTYSYRQTTLDHFESRSMFCPNSFGMKVVNFKRKDPTHTLFNFPFSCGNYETFSM